MIVVTTPYVAGHRVRESKGMVWSNRRMRVWLDSTSGERRYRAED